MGSGPSLSEQPPKVLFQVVIILFSYNCTEVPSISGVRGLLTGCRGIGSVGWFSVIYGGTCAGTHASRRDRGWRAHAVDAIYGAHGGPKLRPVGQNSRGPRIGGSKTTRISGAVAAAVCHATRRYSTVRLGIAGSSDSAVLQPRLRHVRLPCPPSPVAQAGLDNEAIRGIIMM